jgi:hypothetical protein
VPLLGHVHKQESVCTVGMEVKLHTFLPSVLYEVVGQFRTVATFQDPLVRN